MFFSVEAVLKGFLVFSFFRFFEVLFYWGFEPSTLWQVLLIYLLFIYEMVCARYSRPTGRQRGERRDSFALCSTTKLVQFINPM